jgi:hypothetical protein
MAAAMPRRHHPRGMAEEGTNRFSARRDRYATPAFFALQAEEGVDVADRNLLDRAAASTNRLKKMRYMPASIVGSRERQTTFIQQVRDKILDVMGKSIWLIVRQIRQLSKEAQPPSSDPNKQLSRPPSTVGAVPSSLMVSPSPSSAIDVLKSDGLARCKIYPFSDNQQLGGNTQ